MTISIANHKHKTLVTYEILRSNIEQLTPRQWKTACLPMIACRTGVSSGNFVWYCQAAGSMTCAQASITFWVVLTCFDQCWATCSFFFSGVFPWSYLDRPCLRLVVVDNAFPCKRKCATMPLINPYPDIVTVWSLLPCGPLSSQGSQAFWHRQLSNVSDRFRSFQIVSGCSGRIYVGRMLGGVAGYGSDGLQPSCKWWPRHPFFLSFKHRKATLI